MALNLFISSYSKFEKSPKYYALCFMYNKFYSNSFPYEKNRFTKDEKNTVKEHKMQAFSLRLFYLISIGNLI